MIIRYALAGAGAALLIAAGAASYYRGQAKARLERALRAEANVEILLKDRAAADAASKAFDLRVQELQANIDAASLALQKARQNDETLDRCLRYDPGVDITGLRNRPD